MQLMSHVFCATLHDEHCGGHMLLPLPLPGPSIFGPSFRTSVTQKPSWQVRPVEQSDCFVHV